MTVPKKKKQPRNTPLDCAYSARCLSAGIFSAATLSGLPPFGLYAVEFRVPILFGATCGWPLVSWQQKNENQHIPIYFTLNIRRIGWIRNRISCYKTLGISYLAHCLMTNYPSRPLFQDRKKRVLSRPSFLIPAVSYSIKAPYISTPSVLMCA